MKKITFLLLIIISNSYLVLSQSTATYDVVFESIWDTETNDPTNGCSTINLPSNAHWSPLVGATHATTNTFFETNQAVSSGIESVAETGAFATFETEVNSNSDADQFIMGSGLGTARGTITISNLQVNENYPLLTLISMIAPTPDWFIAINSYDLQQGGSWVNSVTIDLFPYDAGTEDGSEYKLDNADTNPQGVMTSRSNTTPFNDKKIGTITITLKSVLNTKDNPLEQLRIYPNPARDFIIISNPQRIALENAEIYNVLGKLTEVVSVREEIQSKLRIDTSNLSSGVYLLKLNTIDSETSTRKLVIR